MPRSPSRPPYGLRCRTIWFEATTMTSSSHSCAMPQASSAPRPEFGENLFGVLSDRGGRRPALPRSAVEVGRRGHHRHTGVAVGHIDDTARGVELLVGDDVG